MTKHRKDIIRTEMGSFQLFPVHELRLLCKYNEYSSLFQSFRNSFDMPGISSKLSKCPPKILGIARGVGEWKTLVPFWEDTGSIETSTNVQFLKCLWNILSSNYTKILISFDQNGPISGGNYFLQCKSFYFPSG